MDLVLVSKIFEMGVENDWFICLCPQMICSCSFLYVMRHWKVISFNAADTSSAVDNPVTLVPLKTLIHTLPLSLTYLLYMVCVWNTDE